MSERRARGAGQLVRTLEGWSARVRVGPSARPLMALAVSSEAEAARRLEQCADAARSLRAVPALTTEQVAGLVRAIASAPSKETLAAALGAVEIASSPGGVRRIGSGSTMTFARWAEEWTSGRLHARFPDHVGAKDSARDLECLKYINAAIGDVRVTEIRLEHAERVLASLPAHLSPRTRKMICQVLRRTLALAVYPGRLIEANPVPREWMPRVGKDANKAKSYLYPSEDRTLLACAEVPLLRRLAYGILAREGMRHGELLGLRWRDLDLEIGRVKLDVNKTSDPRAWSLSPDVARTLAWWLRVQMAEQGVTEAADMARERVIPDDADHAAEQLRDDLETAGVRRAELFERSKSRQPIRVHDLRASFVTVSLASSKTETFVTDRTGHRSSQMLATYTRQARSWSELGLGAFGPLDELLPEVRATVGQSSGVLVARIHEPGKNVAPPAGIGPATFGLGNQGDLASTGLDREKQPVAATSRDRARGARDVDCPSSGNGTVVSLAAWRRR